MLYKDQILKCKRVANTIKFVNLRIIQLFQFMIMEQGHLNCLSELVDETGGIVDIDELPIGDDTLSFKEIIGMESQERMGLIISEKNFKSLKKLQIEKNTHAKVGKITGDKKFIIKSQSSNEMPINLELSDFLVIPKDNDE